MRPDTSPAAAAAAARVVETRVPRPYTERYPIPDEVVKELKEKAKKLKPTHGPAVASVDKPSKQQAQAPTALAASAALTAPAAAPVTLSSFAGIGDTTWLPPDCTMAAGPDHVLLAVNSTVAIHSKASGAAMVQQTLTAWFANVVRDMTIFDPVALYDQHDGRYVLLAVAFTTASQRSVFLLSVSASADPLGPWHNHVLDATMDGGVATNNWADYPAIGVDSHALYITANMFRWNGAFQYAKIRVVPKAGPYSAGPVLYHDFVRMKNADGSMAFTIQPCHTFGAPQVEYLVNSQFPSGNSLTLWQIRNPGTMPVLTRQRVKTGRYTLPPNAAQPGGAPDLNTGDVRLLRAIFRGDSIWTALTTARKWGNATRASVHWLQIRPATNSLVQEGVFGSASAHYYYPAACPDNNGNMIMVFSRSGTTEYGSIALTGRRATDALGKLQTSILLKAGVSHYARLDSHGRNRWGDYNGIAADPVDPRLVWVYSQYASAQNTWGTWVGSSRF